MSLCIRGEHRHRGAWARGGMGRGFGSWRAVVAALISSFFRNTPALLVQLYFFYFALGSSLRSQYVGSRSAAVSSFTGPWPSAVRSTPAHSTSRYSARIESVRRRTI